MDKNKRYYWRHKKTRQFISDGLDEYTDTWVTGLPTGGIDENDEVTKAQITPNCLIDLGFNLFYFDAVEIDGVEYDS